MRTLPLALACLLAAGCRVDPNVVLLERENRMLEDRIYALEDLLDKTQAALDSCQRNGAAGPYPGQPPLLTPVPAPGGGPALMAPQQGPRAAPDTQPLRPPTVVVPGVTPGQPAEKIQDPTWPGNPARPAIPRQPSGAAAPPGSALLGIPPGALRSRMAQPTGQRMAASNRVPAPRVDNTQVHAITLHRLLTGGYNADGRPGHEGVGVLVEPRDAQGRLVNAAAPVSVVVLDRAATGEAARVARWDFAADQLAALWRKMPLGEGFMLQMPWPDQPPAHGQLKLFIRFTTDDGRKLEADRDIEVQLAGLPTAEWSPAGPRELPAQGGPAPLWQQRRLATQNEGPALEPAETAQRPPAPPPPAESDTPPAQTALDRPAWSPHRR